MTLKATSGIDMKPKILSGTEHFKYGEGREEGGDEWSGIYYYSNKLKIRYVNSNKNSYECC